MSQIKLRAPAGMSSFSLSGFWVEIQNGFAKVDAPHVAACLSHGFIIDDADVAPGDLDRAGCVRAVSEAARAWAEQWSDHHLQAFASMPVVDRVAALETLRKGLDKEPAEPEPAEDPAPLPDKFDGMNRVDLFAWLKEHGAAAGPATSDETLRKIARGHAVNG